MFRWDRIARVFISIKHLAFAVSCYLLIAQVVQSTVDLDTTFIYFRQHQVNFQSILKSNRIIKIIDLSTVIVDIFSTDLRVE